MHPSVHICNSVICIIIAHFSRLAASSLIRHKTSISQAPLSNPSQLLVGRKSSAGATSVNATVPANKCCPQAHPKSQMKHVCFAQISRNFNEDSNEWSTVNKSELL